MKRAIPAKDKEDPPWWRSAFFVGYNHRKGVVPSRPVYINRAVENIYGRNSRKALPDGLKQQLFLFGAAETKS